MYIIEKGIKKQEYSRRGGSYFLCSLKIQIILQFIKTLSKFVDVTLLITNIII